MQNREATSASRLWTKDYAGIILFGVTLGVGNLIMMTGVPLYAVHIGGSNTVVGLMMGIFMTAAILIRPYFGNLADLRTRRLVLLMGGGICSISFALHNFAHSIGMLLFLRVLNGIGFSANTNAAGTVLSDIVPRERLGEGIGYFGVADVLSGALGPVLALWLIKQFGFKSMFMTATIFGLTSIIFCFLIDYEKDKKPYVESATDETRAKGLLSYFEQTAIPPSFVMLFVALAMGSYSFLPLYAITRDVSDLGPFFTIYAICFLSSRILGGNIADRYGAHTVLVPGFFLLFCSFALLAFAKTIGLFVAYGILYGLGYGFVQPLLNSLMIRNCPPHKRGAGNSTFYTAMDIGSGGGAVIWGVVSQYFGFTYVYLLCALSVATAYVLYVLLLRKNLKDRSSAETSTSIT